MNSPNASNKSVLVVDLDHSLIKTDLLDEALVGFLKKNPMGIFSLVKHLFAGRLQLKQFLAEKVEIRPEILPYNAHVLTTIEQARARGDLVVLASASASKYVEKVAAHLNIFNDWMGSEQVNLKGIEKLNALKVRFPDAKITYIGDSRSDLPIWKDLGHAYIVGAKSRIQTHLRNCGISVEMLKNERDFCLKTLSKCLRVHQWAKNILIFFPLLVSFSTNWSSWLNALLAFAAFCMTASSVYILNDLLDLDADRQHKTKRFRPFAAGSMSIRSGFMLWGILILLAVGLVSQINTGFALCLFIYFCINLAYSFKLKQVHSLDVILLAGMYTSRIIAGGEAADIQVSEWLLAFSTFMFFGLAILKRYVELAKLSHAQAAIGRGYRAEDKFMLGALGAGSSLLSCLVLALYFNSSNVSQLYSSPSYLWLILPLQLYWTCQIWILAGRGEVDSDPVLHTIKSKGSYVIGLVALLVLYYAHQF